MQNLKGLKTSLKLTLNLCRLDRDASLIHDGSTIPLIPLFE